MNCAHYEALLDELSAFGVNPVTVIFCRNLVRVALQSRQRTEVRLCRTWKISVALESVSHYSPGSVLVTVSILEVFALIARVRVALQYGNLIMLLYMHAYNIHLPLYAFDLA